MAPHFNWGTMREIMPSEAKVITIGELADYLHVHRSTLYRLLKRGQLPGFKIGSDWRFNVETIDRWRMGQTTALDGTTHEAHADVNDSSPTAAEERTEPIRLK